MGSIPVGTTFVNTNKLKERVLGFLFRCFRQRLVNRIDKSIFFRYLNVTNHD